MATIAESARILSSLGKAVSLEEFACGFGLIVTEDWVMQDEFKTNKEYRVALGERYKLQFRRIKAKSPQDRTVLERSFYRQVVTGKITFPEETPDSLL